MDNLLGEFLGTMVLCAFGCGVVASTLLTGSKGQNGGWIVITAGWAFAVVMGVYTAVTCGAPQADLNPSVTLAKYFMGIYTSFGHVLATMLAELAGGFVGGVICYLAYLGHWEKTEDQGFKLGIFCTGPAIRNTTNNFICEVIATFFLIFGIFCIFGKNVGGMAPGMGPYMVGILIWALGMSFGGPTGYALNLARDLGPRLAHAVLPIPGKGGSDWGYAWIPCVAPLVGASIAYVFGHAIGIM